MEDDDYGWSEDASSSAPLLGTALPALEEDEATTRKHKPIAVEDQIVTDENGRRRFHGAFTGGFSAGFFNTAGSRDGWAPKQFKSTRANRQQQQQKPEDFMDAEDMGDFGFAPQTIRATGQFRKEQEKSGSRKREAEDTFANQGPIPGDPVLDQLLKPAHETIGTTLLRRMGWRPGQGIGPRLSRRHRRRNRAANVRMFGSTLPESYQKRAKEDEKDDEEDDLDEEKYKDFLFAPDDVPEFLANPKDNQFGIGYSGLDRQALLGVTATGTRGHFSLFDEPATSTSQKKASSESRSTSSALRIKGERGNLSIRGQAFGVGAYEEDDADIYERDDMNRYTAFPRL